jgi:ABC-type multidrug transport system fused ATPase/permease subunit
MLLSFVAKVFWKYNIQNKDQALLNILFFATTVTNYYYLPNYYGHMFDMFNKNIKLFIYAFSFILIMNMLIYFIGNFERYYLTIQRIKIKDFVYESLNEKIKEAYLKNPEDIVIGEKIGAFHQFTSIIGSWYTNSFKYIIPYIITILIFSYNLLKHDYILPLTILGFFISISCIFYLSTKNNADNVGHSTGSYLKLYQEIEDYLSNFLTIYTYNQFDSENKLIDNHSKNYQNKKKHKDRSFLKWGLLATIVSGATLLFVMYRSFQLLGRGVITKGQFLSIYFVGVELVDTLIYLTDILHDMMQEYQSLNKIAKTANIPLSTSTENNNEKAIENKIKQDNYEPRIQTDSLISIQNLEYKYPTSKEAIIQNFNLEINRGDKIVLVGDIGSGKSTLMKIILGLIKPTKGALYLNGHHYTMKEQISLFSKFGYMTQNPILFNRSIFENITFGKPDTSREKVEELLDRFKLKTVFEKLKKGIDTPVGKNGSKLSGGQKQVVWFLRIYLHNPDILLLDEPTASLSKESKEILINLIKTAFADKTIIISSHDDVLIKVASRKVLMKS